MVTLAEVVGMAVVVDSVVGREGEEVVVLLVDSAVEREGEREIAGFLEGRVLGGAVWEVSVRAARGWGRYAPV